MKNLPVDRRLLALGEGQTKADEQPAQRGAGVIFPHGRHEFAKDRDKPARRE
jgi:hypothetical protein